MDKCREAFEQICYQNKWNINKDGHGFYVDDFVNGAWYMHQSRQAKVNQLQAQINEMAEVGLSQESALLRKDERIEVLENRIEEGLGFIDQFYCEGRFESLDRAEEAMRGES